MRDAQGREIVHIVVYATSRSKLQKLKNRYKTPKPPVRDLIEQMVDEKTKQPTETL